MTKGKVGMLRIISGAWALTIAVLLLGFAATAQSQTLFTDDFQDGNGNGWSKSSGTWIVATDGSLVFRQTGTSADSRARAGSTSWSNYSVQARVKPIAFNGSNRYVGLIARATNSNHFYYLALTNGNQLVLAKRDGDSSTTLASRSFTVSAGTFYTLRIVAQGSSLTAFVNGAQQLTASDSDFSTGAIGVASFFASGSFDDVVVTSGGGGPIPTPTPTPTPGVTPTPTPTPTVTPTPTPTPPIPGGGPIGYASVNALGRNGTTGGAGGATVTVTNATALIEAIGRSGPLVVRVNGMITLPAEMHRISSDKTILGVGVNSGISTGGFNMTGGVNNIIIRNMRFLNAFDDSINIQESSHHIWIDHCDLSMGHDGLLDIKRGSDFITVSWNYFHNHDKTALLSHDDGNAAQDLGHLRVTYHHNWFDTTVQRHPRVRFADPVHVFNNYYLSNSGYGVASTMNAGVLVEGNYFESVPHPTVIQTGDSDPGRLVQRNNFFVNSGTPETAGSVGNPSYSYTLDNAANVKSIVIAGSGVGKIGL